jgi:hypothetical protein
MRFRKLRIAFSAVCGVVCLLLIVLWVRSYYVADGFAVRWNRKIVELTFNSGSLEVLRNNGLGLVTPELRWYRRSPDMHTRLMPSWSLHDKYFHAFCPNWCALLIADALAGAPWLPWRFSLRTLLIATTLVAAVLGLIVWLGLPRFFAPKITRPVTNNLQ